MRTTGSWRKWPADREALTVPTPFGETRVNACGPRRRAPAAPAPGRRRGDLGLLVRPGRRPRPDPPGPGRGPARRPGTEPGRRPPPPRTVADLAGWLDAVLAGLGVAAADVGGHSTARGSPCTTRCALPARVRRLLFLPGPGRSASPRVQGGVPARALPMLLRPAPRRVRAFPGVGDGGAAPGSRLAAPPGGGRRPSHPRGPGDQSRARRQGAARPARCAVPASWPRERRDPRPSGGEGSGGRCAAAALAGDPPCCRACPTARAAAGGPETLTRHLTGFPVSSLASPHLLDHGTADEELARLADLFERAALLESRTQLHRRQYVTFTVIDLLLSRLK
ncbi:hypothetical protein LT493_10850 [Streptomyces tricolor]|nr:hypothetical protein [Streptomyces tricolor]